MNLLVCEFATKKENRKRLLKARLLRHFISCRGRWRVESWQRRPIGLGPVVQTPVSANPGLNFNLGFFIFLLKALSIFSILFRVTSHQIVGKES